KDLGEAAYILGIKIYRDRSMRLIGLNQSAYIDKILNKFNIQNSKKGFIPMEVKHDLSNEMCASSDEEKAYMKKVPYASAVGSIMYAVRCKRPDVAFAQNLITPNKEKIEDHFKDEKKLVMKSLQALKQADVAKMDYDLKSGQAALEIGEEQKKCVILDKAMISLTKNTYETFMPAVIEPGFGIGRIVYYLCEHMFCLGEKGKLADVAVNISKCLTKEAKLNHKTDFSGMFILAAVNMH
nr:retrotransposon protein, putative, Ty1-copia subclass [Tanacetum cinerariifolium]